MSKWKTVNDFINSNEIFTKSDLKKNISGFKDNNYSYIFLLIKIGLLCRIDLEKYKRIYKVPENVSYNKIKKISHSSDYDRISFFKLITRNEKLQKIKNSSLN